MIDDDLARLRELRDRGALSADEYERAKTRLLNPSAAGVEPMAGPSTALYWGMRRNTYCMLMHLAQLACFLLPVIGIALPIVMWVLHKDRDGVVDAHGRAIVNWLISSLIYGAVCIALAPLGIGVVLGIALIAVYVAFAIIGAVQANNGLVWRYPLAIPFLRVGGGDRTIRGPSPQV